MKSKKELDLMSTKDLLKHYRQQRNGIVSGAFTMYDYYVEDNDVLSAKNDESIEHLKYLDIVLTMLGQRKDLTDAMRKETLEKIILN